jgi:hypothetical protein
VVGWIEERAAPRRTGPYHLVGARGRVVGLDWIEERAAPRRTFPYNFVGARGRIGDCLGYLGAVGVC